MAVWKTDVGRLYIVAESGSMKGSQVDLAAMEAKHFEATINLNMGPAKTKVCLQSWFLKWPRAPKCRVLVSTKSLYDLLGLDQFSSEWWRWAWAGLPRWAKRLEEYGMQQHSGRTIVRLSCPTSPDSLPNLSWSGELPPMLGLDGLCCPSAPPPPPSA